MAMHILKIGGTLAFLRKSHLKSTIWLLRGYGWFGLGKTSFSQTSKLFSTTYTNVFSVQDIFSPGISSQDIFPPQNQSARYFLLKSPVPLSPFPSKVKWSAPQFDHKHDFWDFKKTPKECRERKKRNLSQSWVKISVEEWETIKCQISNFSKNWTHLSIQSYSQYLSLFSHLNQPYNYLKTITKGLKVQDIEHNSQHTIKYQTR